MSKPRDDEDHSSGSDFNDQLTIEGMLEIEDIRPGKKTGDAKNVKGDVRALLGIKEEDIKRDELRTALASHSIMNESVAGGDDLGEYFAQLNTLKDAEVYDMGQVDDDDDGVEESKTPAPVAKPKRINQTAWSDWWKTKQVQNDKLKDAIIGNDHAKVKELLFSQDLIVQGFQADVNFKVTNTGFVLTPLLLAIQCYRQNQNEQNIIKELVNNYADLNASEEKFGFTALVMACHLNTEKDALTIAKLLCSHSYDKKKTRVVNVDTGDLTGNTPLHHAAWTNKTSVCKFLIEEQKVNIECVNENNERPIDLTTNAETAKYLTTYMAKTDPKLITKKGKAKKAEEEDFIRASMAEPQAEEPSGRRSISISSGKKGKKQVSMNNFKIIDRLGNGAFGTVYCVHQKNLPKGVPQTNYAMKTLEKESVLKQNLARYALTERNVLSVAGKHPLVVGLDFAFQTSYRLYLIMEYCPGGDMEKQIRLKKKFTEEEARLYICQVILAIEHLHKHNIIFRDLKPGNIVLDKNGNVKLTDFGLSKENVGELSENRSFVGSIAYLAPEILKKQAHHKSIDWYLTGVLLYEMLVGIPPYYNNNRKILFENIREGPLRIPHTMSKVARDLILNLLNRNPKKRMGASARDADELKEHEFFKEVNWQDVIDLKIEMPKIEVNRDMKYNPEAEQAFKKGETASEATMNKLYKQMKKDGGYEEVKAKDESNKAFQHDPNKMQNWSFVGDLPD